VEGKGRGDADVEGGRQKNFKGDIVGAKNGVQKREWCEHSSSTRARGSCLMGSKKALRESLQTKKMRRRREERAGGGLERRKKNSQRSCNRERQNRGELKLKKKLASGKSKKDRQSPGALTKKKRKSESRRNLKNTKVTEERLLG